MLAIQKLNIPKLLVEYKAKPGATYDGPDFTPVKDAIRTQLVAEQKGLCAYCMRRIKANAKDMKVEHWRSQKNYPELQLEYSNMLGVCFGHEGKPPKDQTCDTRKGDFDIKYDPSKHDVFSIIGYASADGKIFSSDKDFELQLGHAHNSVLNLNLSLLMDNRKAVMKGVTNIMGAKPGPRKKAEIRQMIENVSSKAMLSEYAGVQLFLLQRYLSKAT